MLIKNTLSRMNPSRICRAPLLAFFTFAIICLITAATTARAWDYEGHRAINLVALSAMPSDFPKFLKTPAAQNRIGFLAGEPDRWRNSFDPSLRHINQSEHFFDMEELEPLGMKFMEVSQFRYVFVAELTRAQAAHPEVPPKVAPEKDKDATGRFPGFLPWAIAENYGKLKSAFSCLRAYELHGGTDAEIANMHENIAYIMGTMGHYVGDAVQPLHNTMHFNGWVGDNPNRYTTRRNFHSWIDGGFITKTGPIDIASLSERIKPAERLSSATADSLDRDPIFVQILSFMVSQHPKVDQVYKLDKEGKLDAQSSGAKEGRAFIENQMVIGAKFLADLWYTAYKTAPEDKFLGSSLERRRGGGGGGGE